MTHHLPTMDVIRIVWITLLLMVVAKTGAAQGARLGWADTAELTLVFTGGNAEATTLGLRNELIGNWENSSVSVEISALRAQSSQTTRSATGPSPLTFQVSTQTASIMTAEHYFVHSRYDRHLGGKTFWYVGAGWDRNTFAGFDHRYTGNSGLGHTWLENDTWTFKTAYGVGYTLQRDIAPAPGVDDGFAGIRLSYEFKRQVTPTTEFTSGLVADENLEKTSDLRTDLINAIAVDMTSQLALKVSWKLLYDHLPSQVAIPLRLPNGDPTGNTVLTPLASVDQIVTFALVASF